MVQLLDPFACAALVLLSMAVAGAAQTAWLKLPASARFAVPLDGGARFRGRRLFGDNKTARGFVVIVPVGALATGVLGPVFIDAGASVWNLSALSYAGLGAFAATGLMLGELPNSFLKRQLDVPPGGAPRGRVARVVAFSLDRFDSVLGTLIAVALVVPTPAATWLWAVLLGPPLHWSFSVALWVLGVKRRPA
jgi:CDP-diglyceride synthetase